MKTLYLFKELTPNIKQHPYFNIKVFANYLNYLKSHYSYIEISDDNYRINASIIKISSSNLTFNDFTYAIETDGAGWHKCYYVDAITEQSNMLYLSLTIDLWGSYYIESNIDYLHITRCNRNIGTGIYDDIRQIKGNYLQDRFIKRIGGNEDNLYNINNVYLVIALSYNAIESGFTDSQSTTQLFAISLRQLKEFYTNTRQEGDITITYYEGQLYEMISDFLTGIYGVGGTSWLRNLDATATKAYLITDLTNDLLTSSGIIIKFKSVLHHVSDNTLTFKYLPPKRKRYGFNLNDIENEINVDYDFIAGTNGNKGLKLVRYTNKTQWTFEYLIDIKQAEINIIIRQGENEEDVTQNFEIAIAGGANITSSLEKIGQGLGFALTSVMGAIKGYSKMGTAGALLSLGSNVTSLMAQHGPTLNANVIGNGDAFHTYNILYNAEAGYTESFVYSPYCINKYLSVIDENRQARYFGAQFNEIYGGVSPIFYRSLLGEGLDEDDYNLTLVVADEVKVNNLPTLARQYIENAFNAGVELFNYEGTASE